MFRILKTFIFTYKDSQPSKNNNMVFLNTNAEKVGNPLAILFCGLFALYTSTVLSWKGTTDLHSQYVRPCPSTLISPRQSNILKQRKSSTFQSTHVKKILATSTRYLKTVKVNTILTWMFVWGHQSVTPLRNPGPVLLGISTAWLSEEVQKEEEISGTYISVMVSGRLVGISVSPLPRQSTILLLQVQAAGQCNTLQEGAINDWWPETEIHKQLWNIQTKVQ